MRTDKLREEFDLNIRLSIFPLHPETSDEGRALAELFAARYDIDGCNIALPCKLAEIAESVGLDPDVAHVDSNG